MENSDSKNRVERLKQLIRDAQGPFTLTTICGLIQVEMARLGHPVSLKRPSCFDRFTSEQLDVAEQVLPTVLGTSLPQSTIEEIAVARRTASQ